VLSDTFIRRPILATVCSLLIILAGAICIPLLPIARYPALTPPAVSVQSFYTGANAQAVESAVTTPLEQAINGVEGMTYIQSSSTNSGLSTINVYFEVGRDPDLAAVDVQNRVNQALGRLPADVRTNGISVIKQTAGFMGGLGFFSKDNRYSAQFISNYLDLYVRDALKRVPGVGNVIIFGERKYAMRLWLDPARLAGRGITAGDVVAALREQNLQVAAGALGDAPAAADQAFTLSVRALGRLSEPSQFENVIVKAGKGAALVRVRDIGRVELGAETYAANLRFAGLEASGMGVQLLPTANALQVFDGVMKEMARLEKSFPPGLEWRLAFDNVSVVRESIKEVLVTLAEAIVLVVLVIFLFLQNWRSTLIPAIHPRLADRHLRFHTAVQLLDQHPDPVRHRARHRHRGRRRDRGDREHRAPHAGGEAAGLSRGLCRDARGVLRGSGDRSRAGGRVRAGGLLRRHHGPALPAVLADDRLRRGALGLQRRHLHAGALGAAARP
jgi:HAE1 family hydrophobic/amphiphilic exporter-1